ncbi:hypothetical protein DAPPUDRAFT_277864, partial [Daphnia pulex]
MQLARAIEFDAAAIYERLLAKQDYYESHGMLNEQGYFYLKVEDLQYETTLGEKAQRRIIAHLVKLKILQYKRAGLPAKRWFKIGDDEKTALEAILISSSKREELDPPIGSKAGEKYKDFDLAYYYEAVSLWSKGGGKKMVDWIACARGFMNRDKAEGKAKMSVSVILDDNAKA